MKRLLPIVFTVLVMLNCAIAVSGEESINDDNTQVSATVTVYSIDELQAAIAAADDGDTITIAQTIVVENTCAIGKSDKQITFVCADGFQGDTLMELSGYSVVFMGITFDGGYGNKPIYCKGNRVFFGGCAFVGNETTCISGTQRSIIACSSCTFRNNSSLVKINGNSSFTMTDCVVEDNSAPDSVFYIEGSIMTTNCLFRNNATRESLIRIIGNDRSSIGCQFIGNTTAQNGAVVDISCNAINVSNCYFCSNTGYDILARDSGMVCVFDTDEQLNTIYQAHERNYIGTYPKVFSSESNDMNNIERIELPLENYTGALCFVSETIPDEPENGVDTETQSPTQSTESEPTTPVIPENTMSTMPPPTQQEHGNTNPAIPNNGEDAVTDDTENDVYATTIGNKSYSRYIVYTPQGSATEDTEPPATSNDVTETSNAPTTHQGSFQQENVKTIPISGSETAETVQDRTSSIDELAIALQELRVLVRILISLEVFQTICFVIIWTIFKAKGKYKGRYKR